VNQDPSPAKYRAWIDDGEVSFEEPEPSGAQMLAAAGREPVDEHVLIQQLSIGSRVVGLDESVELRGSEKRHFYTFRSGTIYQFTVDTHMYHWGREQISIPQLRSFARVPEEKELALLSENAAPRILQASDFVALSSAGTEHLRTQERQKPPEHHPEPPKPVPPPQPEYKLKLIIVVNGQPVEIEVNEHAPLGSVIERVLHLSGNDGQPPDAWQLRDAAGAELDLDKKIGEYQFAPGTTLFLNLKAGVGG